MSKKQPGSFAYRGSLAFCAAIAVLAGCGGSPSLSPGANASAAGGQKRAPPTTAKVIYRFKGGADGEYPLAGLLAENGQFYGTTANGGTGGGGTVFSVSTSGTKTTLYNFQSSPDGNGPYASVIAGPDGALYGDTVNGGSYTCNAGGCGAVYELLPSGSGYTEKVIYTFQGGSDGEYPFGGLLLDQSGALYGTTVAGGGGAACSNPSYTGGCGTVFKLTPSASGFTETVLYSFQGGNDGAYPVATVFADGSGTLYGTTEYGGASTSECSSPSGDAGCGTVFKLAPSSSSGYSESILYRFQGGSDGAVPRSALLAASNGTFFGATSRGGKVGTSTNHGVVYELTPSGSGYSERVAFTFDSHNGAFPYDNNGLYADSHGNLYGTTVDGVGCCGAVFKLTPSGSGFKVKILHRFAGAAAHDGKQPYGSVVADVSGTLYGTTRYGGLNKGKHPRVGYGTIFQITL